MSQSYNKYVFRIFSKWKDWQKHFLSLFNLSWCIKFPDALCCGDRMLERADWMNSEIHTLPNWPGFPKSIITTFHRETHSFEWGWVSCFFPLYPISFLKRNPFSLCEHFWITTFLVQSSPFSATNRQMISPANATESEARKQKCAEFYAQKNRNLQLELVTAR